MRPLPPGLCPYCSSSSWFVNHGPDQCPRVTIEVLDDGTRRVSIAPR